MTSSKPWVAYCTNVHAGRDFAEVRANLDLYAARVAHLRNRKTPQGVGLWLAEPAASETAHRLDELKAWLISKRLEVRTFNGFPQSNFHQPVVKHLVYAPAWWEEARYKYTSRLLHCLADLLPEGCVGSISTLPIGWGTPTLTFDQLTTAAAHLRQIAEDMERLWEQTGKEIVLAIEPEPGCFLGDSSSLRHFFQRHLLMGPNLERHRRFLTVCHDVCHAAVMREDQGLELQAYRDNGIRIGKVQVSSAVHVDWDVMDDAEKRRAWEQLSHFGENRYLHQTTVQSGPAGSVRLHEDLKPLMESTDPRALRGSWRVHFHIPIYVDRFGELGSTSHEIRTCVHSLASADPEFFTGHWEVETYAWGVLPDTLAQSDLAEGIARELDWFEQMLPLETGN